MNPNWSAAGYLNNAKTFPGLYQWFASAGNIGWINFVNEWGLTLVGAALIFGLLVRWASIGGIFLMILYYLPILQFPIVGPSDLVGLPYQSTIFPFDEAVTIYSLTEENKEAPLSFMFAVRNDFPENKPPTLHHIADKTFRVGDVWKEIVTAEDSTNDLLEFSSDSSLFPIQPDGTIDVPITQAGEFAVIFTVEDHRRAN